LFHAFCDFDLPPLQKLNSLLFAPTFNSRNNRLSPCEVITERLLGTSKDAIQEVAITSFQLITNTGMFPDSHANNCANGWADDRTRNYN